MPLRKKRDKILRLRKACKGCLDFGPSRIYLSMLRATKKLLRKILRQTKKAWRLQA